jgi:hypothetical protein
VQALLTATPAFHSLPAADRRELAGNLVSIAAYAAELVRDDWYQSAKLGQRPVLKQRWARPLAAGDDFRTAASGQVARVTRETLRAIAFPTFVADLIRSTFHAIVQASIEQMEAYGKLLANVSKTVDQFMADNITDDQARDWLAQAFPEHVMVQNRKVVPRSGADERPPPDWKRLLGLSQDVTLDGDAFEEVLVPAARRKMAQGRLQLLSTMVLMGVNRIVVKSGKIRATMGFHIDATDRAHEEQATDFDFRAAAAGSFGYGPWSASASTSVAYVRSTRSDSDAELNVNADLTGEVDIRFQSDYFPLERFVDAGGVDKIRSNTAVPEANAPSGEADHPPVTSQPVAHRPRRTTLPAIGTPLPPPRVPTPPTEPVVQRRVEAPTRPGAAAPATPAPAPAPTTPAPATPAPATTPGRAVAPAAPAPTTPPSDEAAPAADSEPVESG